MSRTQLLILCGTLAGLALARWPDAWPGVALVLAFLAAWPHLAAFTQPRAAGRHCRVEKRGAFHHKAQAGRGESLLRSVMDSAAARLIHPTAGSRAVRVEGTWPAHWL